MIPLLSLAYGLSFLSGLNLYLATFLTSLAVQQGWIDPALHPAVAALGHPAVLVLSLLFVIAEFVLDKIPWVDSLWDAVHTIIRPLGAVTLSFVLLSGAGLTGESATALLAGVGGFIALSTHLTKSGIRLLLNASPEPFTNILASLAEDVILVCLLLLLIQAPVTGFAVCLTLLAGTWITLPRLFRILRMSLWLMWKKLAAFRDAGLPRPGLLPSSLTVREEDRLHTLLEPESPSTSPAIVWALPCIVGKTRRTGGLRAHHSGILVSLVDHPGILVFLYRGWFQRGAVRLSLAGCTVRQETTMLSENLVIHQAGEGLHLIFRFTRGEAGVVATLASDLRRRLGLETPSLPSSPHRPPLSAIPEPAPTIWTAPPALRH